MWPLLLATFITIGHSGTYNEELATNALYYAYGAYCDQSKLIDWTCEWCQHVSSFKVFDGGIITGDSLQAFIGYDPIYSRIILSFRGTHNTKDFLDDLDFVKTPYPNVPASISPNDASIHSGFWESWIELSG